MMDKLPFFWTSGMLVDCKGTFGWCPSNTKIVESPPSVVFDRNMGNDTGKCLALYVLTGMLSRFHCEEQLFFVCEVTISCFILCYLFTNIFATFYFISPKNIHPTQIANYKTTNKFNITYLYTKTHRIKNLSLKINLVRKKLVYKFK